MVDFTYKRYGLKFREIMFAECGKTVFEKEDVCLYHGGNQNAAKDNPQLIGKAKNVRVDHQNTIVTDLVDSEEEQLKRLNKNYRNEISRARREGIITEHFCSKKALENIELLDLFEKMYANMFAEKGMNNKLNREYVNAALSNNQMTISVAKYNDQILVIHAYVNDKKNALLLYSTSLLWEDKEIGKRVGWANKLLHWDDICYFKNAGFEKYEWGGIFSTTEPNGIDQFKLGFGGRVVNYDNCLFANTLKGALYIAAVKVRLRK